MTRLMTLIPTVAGIIVDGRNTILKIISLRVPVESVADLLLGMNKRYRGYRFFRFLLLLAFTEIFQEGDEPHQDDSADQGQEEGHAILPMTLDFGQQVGDSAEDKRAG